MDSTIETAAARIFTDHANDSSTLWKTLEESELTRAWIPRSMDGAGLSITDVFGLIRLSGSTACAVPFAETLLAGHVLSVVDIAVPTGAISVAVPLDVMHDNNNNKTSTFEVPFAQQAEYIVTVAGTGTVALYKTASINDNSLEPVNSVGGDSLCNLHTEDLQPEATVTITDPVTVDSFNQTGALVRTAQMCGAMESILDLTLEHTSTREQFARPLSRFQAIQHLLAEIAGEAAASSAILEAAVEAFEQGNKPDFRTTASAKARTSEAAGIVAANAHQAHGAIGYTQEYALSAWSRRLWRWREEFGNETQWSQLLGNDYLQSSESLTDELFR